MIRLSSFLHGLHCLANENIISIVHINAISEFTGEDDIIMR